MGAIRTYARVRILRELHLTVSLDIGFCNALQSFKFSTKSPAEYELVKLSSYAEKRDVVVVDVVTSANIYDRVYIHS